MRKLLFKFLSHNAGLKQKASSDTYEPHHNGAIWASANISETPTVNPIGWIGGEIRFPQNVKVPTLNNKPYKFLCEIDCARIPAETWSGIGPRNGKLAFLVAPEGRLDVKVIHYTPSDDTSTIPAPMLKNYSAYHSYMEKVPDLVPDLPSWPLQILENCQESDEAYPAKRNRDEDPFRDLDLRDQELIPGSWQELLLLLRLGHARLKERLVSLSRQLEDKQSRFELGYHDEAVVLEKIKKLAADISRELQEKYKNRAITAADWVSEVELLLPLFELEAEARLNSNEPIFFRYTYSLEQKRFLSDYPDNVISLRDNLRSRFHDLKEDLEVARELFTELTGKQADQMGSLELRKVAPELWVLLTQEIRKLEREFVKMEFMAFTHANEIRKKGVRHNSEASGIIAKVGMGELPKSTQDIARKFKSEIEAHEKKLDKISDRETQARELATLKEGFDIVSDATLKFEELEQEMSASSTLPFDNQKCSAVIQWLEHLVDRQCLKVGWHRDYTVLRALLLQAVYRQEPQKIEDRARVLLEQYWLNFAQEAPVQIGGTPRGWCSNFIDLLPNSVVLIQIPSNYLTGHIFGDVYDLVVSIDRKHFRRGKFDKIAFDISN
nr:DUF1963 domain-containing protein [uncultured Cohaesibacter sp.]